LRTLGVDLAAQDKKTASCAIEWDSGRALVEAPLVGRPSGDLIDAMQAADWIGIDAPFGWPDAMVDAIHRYATEGNWPVDTGPDRLRYRMTDRFVHEIIAEERDVSVWPLSVSSDRIAVCAWRCADLLREFSERTGWLLDRVGVPVTGCSSNAASGPPVARGVIEVYPAGALALWGFPFKGYKRTANKSASAAHQQRAAILTALEEAGGGWLVLTEDVRDVCLQDDDAFDSFICGLVARAAATNRTLLPLRDQRTTAAREGWIHLPAPDSIDRLGTWVSASAG
jgi:predicted nuclease with RNAse H fold